MSIITKPEYVDESMKFKIIKEYVARPTYNPLYCFLIDFFEKNNYATVNDVKGPIMVPNYARAFQLLESFCVLGLLEKIKQPRSKRCFFTKKNQNLWSRLKKEVK